MSETITSTLALDPIVLSRAVGEALNREIAPVEQWQVHPAGASRGSATAGVYRVSGTVEDPSGPVEWAVILKVLRPEATAFNPAVRDLRHPIYWKREVLAYQSDLLSNLPGGLAAPRCLAIEERADESCWLWLEEAKDVYGEQWPLAQYGRAARALGRFNGASAAMRSLADYPWLGPPGALRGTLEAFAFVQDRIRDPATWQHPLLRATFSAATVDRLRRLWDDRQPLLEALDRVPSVLCHKDAFRRNMFAQQQAPGRPELVLIDWAYVGWGEVGLDAADLFGASYSNFGVDSSDLRAFDTIIFDGYLAGLRDAGWTGDPRAVRFGFAASAALKYGGLLLWLGDVADEQRCTAWEELSGRPFELFVRHQARLITYLLDLADEARNLLPAL